MSDKHLKKIAKTLDRLATLQEQTVQRLDRLESGGRTGSGASGPEVLAFLDGFRANEALGEASLGAWIAVCQDPCLKGGLRTVQCREGEHARLLEQRLKELGGSPSFEVPEDTYEKAMQSAASTDASDAKKLLDFAAQFPDIDVALAPIAQMADRLDHDPETQSLLRTIMQDERSTLEFLCAACAQLNA